MNLPKTLSAGILLLVCSQLFSQKIDLDRSKLIPVGVSMSSVKIAGKSAVRVTKDSSVKGADQPTFVRLDDVDLTNGTIEVKVLSRLLPDAGEGARGFIGLAFRINKVNDKFECIYIRPTNGRAEDQIRRNHSIQYCSYPGYAFDRLRKEAPEKYESYADMGLNEWITLKIVVNGLQAKLFLNNNARPSLIVNDLKLGSSANGAIGFFVDGGTEGFFRDAKVEKEH